MTAKQLPGVYAPDGSLYITLTDGNGSLAAAGSPGTASTTEMLYNNAGTIDGVSGWTTNGTTTLVGGASTTLSIGGGTALTTSNQTGTGNIVLATSPSLVTPVLGVATGTSLVLSGGLRAQSIERVVNVREYVTGGSGTFADPFTGWDTAITWTAGTKYVFTNETYGFGSLSISVPVFLEGAGWSAPLSPDNFGGAGWSAGSLLGTVLKGTVTTGSLITFNNVATSYSYNLKDLIILGPGSGTSIGVLIGSATVASVKSVWKNVLVANVATGISLVNIQDSFFSNVAVDGCVTGLNLGLNTNQNVFKQLTINHCTTGWSDAGSSGNSVYGALSQNVVTGFNISGDSLSIYDVWGESSTTLFNIDATSVGVKNLKIKGVRSSSTNLLNFSGSNTVNYINVSDVEWGGASVTIPSNVTNGYFQNIETTTFNRNASSASYINVSVGNPKAYFNGVSSMPLVNSSGLSVNDYSLTGSSTTPLVNLSGVWNTTGLPTAFLLNITDTASNAASNLFSFQINGVDKIYGTKNGVLVTADTINSGGDVSALGGQIYNRYAGGAVRISSTGYFGFANGGDGAGTIDTFIGRADAATFRLGNIDAASPVAQTVRGQSVVAGTTNTAAPNITWQAPAGTGTGAGGSHIFQVAPAGSTGTAQNAWATAWQINSEGHLLAGTDNTHDIGAFGATRPRNIYISSNIVAGGTLELNAINIASAGLGVVLLRDNNGNTIDRVQFGGTTSSFPALKRSTTRLQHVLADDSGYAGVDASDIGLVGTSGSKLEILTLTELTTIAAAATTDTTIQIPANAIVLAVQVRTTTVIPTAATYTVIGAGSSTAFNTAAVSTAATSTDPGTAAGAYYNATAQAIRITPNATPADNTGRVRVTIRYILSTPPTS